MTRTLNAVILPGCKPRTIPDLATFGGDPATATAHAYVGDTAWRPGPPPTDGMRAKSATRKGGARQAANLIETTDGGERR